MKMIGDAQEGAESKTAAGDGRPNAFDDVESSTTAVGPDISADPSGLSGRLAHAKAPDSVVITPSEKSAFIDAMLSEDRYTQAVSLFGGKVTAVLRSRTTDETQAMYAYMRHVLSRDPAGGSERLERDMSYILLVAQVDELNGTKFTEMKAPLMYTSDGGAETEPGWIGQLAEWKKRPECVTAALIDQIQKFEYKYWTMVKEADDKNFWSPDTSS